MFKPPLKEGFQGGFNPPLKPLWFKPSLLKPLGGRSGGWPASAAITIIMIIIIITIITIIIIIISITIIIMLLLYLLLLFVYFHYYTGRPASAARSAAWGRGARRAAL